jgi:hypothetical protein
MWRLAIVAALALALSESPEAQSKAADATVIDGATNPELLPQWFIWQGALRNIHHRPPVGPGEPSLQDQLDLPLEVLNYLKGEAKGFVEDEARYVERLTALVATLRAEGKTTKDLFEVAKPLELEERWRILERADRINARLSAEQQLVLWQWIEQTVVRVNRVRVPRSQLQHFLKPR